jgi:hypothetical protein
LRVWAKVLLCLEAAVELLIGHRSRLFREDFLAVAVESGREVFSGREIAAVDFVAAAGALPCSGEGRVLRIAASIAEGVPVDLREAVTGLDENNAVLAAAAVLHAAGHRDLRVAAGGERR